MDIIGHRVGLALRLAAIAVGVTLLGSCAGSDTTTSNTTTDTMTRETIGDAANVTSSSTTVDGVEDAGAAASYTISAGDTLSGIAVRAGVSLADLVAANGWPDGSGHPIFPGDVIALPKDAAVPRPEPDVPRSTSPAGSTPLEVNAALACDGAAMQAAIGDPDFVTFDEISCADGWAGAGYVDSENNYTPVIFRAEGQRWVLQDWSTVCIRYPEMSPAAQLYCPGG